MGTRKTNQYTTIKIPTALASLVDDYIISHPEYTSRTDVAKEALRNYLRDIKVPQNDE